MSVRSFHSIFMAGVVASAALGCYLVSLEVASERASLDKVEGRIAETQGDIRMLQTEIGTRARLGQLEAWNASALQLSAPSASQFLQDSFQLATLVKPEPKLNVQAPVVMADAPAPPPSSALGTPQNNDDGDVIPAPSAVTQPLVHEASLKIETREVPAKAAAVPPAPAKPKSAKLPATAARPAPKTFADKPGLAAAHHAAKPVKLAEADPLAPLPATDKSSSRASSRSPSTARDHGRTK